MRGFSSWCAVVMVAVFQFAGKADDAERLAEERRRQIEEQRRLQIADAMQRRGAALAQNLRQSKDDAIVLEGTLALLQRSRLHESSYHHFVDAVTTLAQHRWKLEKTAETPRDMFARLEQQLGDKDHEQLAVYEMFAEKYEAMMGKPWQLAWRTQRDQVLGLAETVLRSRTAMNPSIPWRKKVATASDPKLAEWYRMGWVTMLSTGVVKPSHVDGRLLSETIDHWGGTSATDLRWQAEILAGLIGCGLQPTDERRAGLRNRFLRNIKDARLTLVALFRVRYARVAIRHLLEIADKKLEKDAIIQALVDHADPDVLTGLQLHGTRHFLKKSITVAYHDQPLNDVLHDLHDRVTLPMLIQDAPAADKSLVTLKMKATWREVIDAVLAKTPYRLSYVEERVYCIGKPMDRKAGELIKRGQAKIPNDGKLERTLRELTLLEFRETPLGDVCGYLEDLHGIQVEVLGDVKLLPITLKLNVPLYVSLSVMAVRTGGDWIALEETVFMGSKGKLAGIQKHHASMITRMAALKKSVSKVAFALRQETRLEFVATPLSDVCDYLKDRHGVQISCPDEEAALLQVTCDHRTSLAWALTQILAEHDLTWETDEKIISIRRVPHRDDG